MRFGNFSTAKLWILCISIFSIGLIGYNTHLRNGLSFRLQDREDFTSYFDNNFPNWQYFNKISLTKVWRAECAFFDEATYFETGVTTNKPKDSIDPACTVRDSSYGKSVLIWGDSHAQALAPGVLDLIPDNWQVLQVASSGCQPDPDVDTPSYENQCQQSNYTAMATIRQAKPDVVIVAQARGHSAQDMEKIAHSLQALGVRKTLLLGPVPQWTTDLPKIIARQLWLIKPRRTFVGINSETNAVNEVLARTMGEKLAKLPAQYVDLIRVFCNEDEGCLTYVEDDMRTSITTWDYGHLTPAASKYLAKRLLVDLIISDINTPGIPKK